MAESCANCRFYLAGIPTVPFHPPVAEGVCRCLSPSGQLWAGVRFPPVDGDDWCGKWEAISGNSPS